MTAAQKIAQAITLLEADVRMQMPGYYLALDRNLVRLCVYYQEDEQTHGDYISMPRDTLAKVKGNPLTDFVFDYLRKYGEAVIAGRIADTNDRMEELRHVIQIKPSLPSEPDVRDLMHRDQAPT